MEGGKFVFPDPAEEQILVGGGADRSFAVIFNDVGQGKECCSGDVTERQRNLNNVKVRLFLGIGVSFFPEFKIR